MRISLRYIFRLISAFLKRFAGLIVLGVVIGIVIFVVLQILLPRLFVGTTKIGITGRYNPDELPHIIINKVSRGLTKVDENQNVIPDIAKSWETTDSGKTWLFELNDNVYWHDGKNLVSKDLSYNFEGVTIEYPEDYKIKFILEDSYAPFPAIVSKPVFKRGLLGVGDWEVKKISLAGGIVSEVHLQNKGRQKIVYKLFPTEERTKLAVKLGHVDKIENMYTKEPFDTWNTLDIKDSFRNDLIVTLFFNYQDPKLSEKSLRQALIYAIKKDNFPNRALSPIPDTSWAFNPQVKQYEYSKERAEEIIKDLPKETLEGLDIKLVTSPTLLSTAEGIVGDWNEIGIKSSVLVSSVIPQEFQAFLGIYEAPNDPDQYTIWHSKQTDSNISNYQNIRIDKLLEDGRIELNFEERRKIYLDFQRYLLEDLPAAFLYHPLLYTIQKK